MAAWVYPTAVPVVTSNFNPTRVHPVTGVVTPHTGTDFRAATGTPLYAATSGTVVRSTDAGGGAGRYIRIDVGGGVWIGYSHLSRRDVAVGARVSVGQVIGLAGATGSVTAPHLHFEVCVNGVKVDPVPYLAARTAEFAGNPGGGSGGGTLPGDPNLPPLEPIEPRGTFMALTYDEERRVLAWADNGPLSMVQHRSLLDQIKAQTDKIPSVIVQETAHRGVTDSVKVDTGLLKAGVATVHDLLVEHATGGGAAAPAPEGPPVLTDADVDRIADAVLARLASIAVTITPTVEGA